MHVFTGRVDNRSAAVRIAHEVYDAARAATEAGLEVPHGQPDGWGGCGYRPGRKRDETFDPNASRTNHTAPVEIPRLEDVQHIAAGARHGVAVTPDDVYACGDNGEGQLGNGTTAPGYESVKILDESSAIKGVAASLGGNTTYAY